MFASTKQNAYINSQLYEGKRITVELRRRMQGWDGFVFKRYIITFTISSFNNQNTFTSAYEHSIQFWDSQFQESFNLRICESQKIRRNFKFKNESKNVYYSMEKSTCKNWPIQIFKNFNFFLITATSRINF